MAATSARSATAGFVISGLALAAYPALRPWAPEGGLVGAASFASTAWPISHLLGMVGFVSLALAVRALVATAAAWPTRTIRATETLAWLAAAFLLPYYGAEAFALQALGAYAAQSGDVAALEVANSFRYAPLPLTTFAIGLLLLLIVGVRLAVAFWRSGSVGRIGGILTAAGTVTYLPQFFGTPAMRIGHGLVLGIGLVLLGLAVTRVSAAQTSRKETLGTASAGPAASVTAGHETVSP